MKIKKFKETDYSRHYITLQDKKGETISIVSQPKYEQMKVMNSTIDQQLYHGYKMKK